DIVLCKFYFSDIKKSKNRPVLIFKDNLPYDDFVAIPISSKIDKLHKDEVIISIDDLFEGILPKTSKLMIRKTFIVSKQVVLKKYATISKDAYLKYHQIFCNYFGCKL
ncbi:MAG TPA: type II toxin-antitoxin system PemK/MazF family toxin, partial [Campylobacterales bacterium]|nr:type II toxin-antitoxin system PemK/MazF family toxin [Campylobacterales bacterium]